MHDYCRAHAAPPDCSGCLTSQVSQDAAQATRKHTHRRADAGQLHRILFITPLRHHSPSFQPYSHIPSTSLNSLLSSSQPPSLSIAQKESKNTTLHIPSTSTTISMATTTNEPDKMYCNLSHEDMQIGSKRICWSQAVENKLYQFCAAYDISQHALPSGQKMIMLMQYIDFDTEDEVALRNAVTKVCTWIIGHVKPSTMSGTLEEVCTNPERKKMATWRIRFCVFAKTWLDNQYDVVGRGMAPAGANLEMGEWKDAEWRGKDVCIAQAVSWKKAHPGEVVSLPRGGGGAATPAATNTPTNPTAPVNNPNAPTNATTPAATAATPAPQVVHVNSAFHDRIVDFMLQGNPNFSREDMEEWLNTEQGMTHVMRELMNNNHNDDETTAALQEQVQTGEAAYNSLEARFQDAEKQHEKQVQDLQSEFVTFKAQQEAQVKEQIDKTGLHLRQFISRLKQENDTLQANAANNDEEYENLNSWAQKAHLENKQYAMKIEELEREIGNLKAQKAADGPPSPAPTDYNFIPAAPGYGREPTVELPLTPRASVERDMPPPTPSAPLQSRPNIVAPQPAVPAPAPAAAAPPSVNINRFMRKIMPTAAGNTTAGATPGPTIPRAAAPSMKNVPKFTDSFDAELAAAGIKI